MWYTARWYKPEKIEPFPCSTDVSYNFDVGTKLACMSEIHTEAEKKFKSIYGESTEYNPDEMRIYSCRTSVEIINRSDNRLLVCAEFPGNGMALIIVPDEVYEWHKDDCHLYFSDRKNGMVFSSFGIHEQVTELYKEMAQTGSPLEKEFEKEEF